MRDVEERLRKVAVPRPEVPAFRARLRSRLLEACRAGAPSPAEGAYLYRYRSGFVLCGTCALLLAFVVGLFVWNPAWPARIHGTIWGRGESRTATVRTGPEGLEKQAVPHLPSVPGPGRRSGEKPVPLVSADPLSMDRDFLLQWAGGILKKRGVRPDALAPLDAYTVSRFRLPGGRYVDVYTRLPAGERTGLQTEPMKRRVY